MPDHTISKVFLPIVDKWNLFRFVPLLLALLAAGPAAGQQAASQAAAASGRQAEVAPPARTETVIPYQGSLIVIKCREQNAGKGVFQAAGDVEIRYQDMIIRGDHFTYDTENQQLTGEGNINYRKGEEEIRCHRFQFNLKTRQGHFEQMQAKVVQTFQLETRNGDKVGEHDYDFEDGSVTSCNLERGHWHWHFTSRQGQVRLDDWTTLRGSVLRIGKIPVFYLPWVKVPVIRKERKSGLKIPLIGQSSMKGFCFSDGLFLTLGRSADLTIEADYYSKRGYGLGTVFRSRLSEDTFFNLSTYTVSDRQEQDGTAVNADMRFRFGGGWRGAVFANYISNINMRRTFDESFSGAVRPDERISGFLCRAWTEMLFAVEVDRQRYYLASSQQLQRTTPRVSWHLPGIRLGNLPVYAFVEATGSALFKQTEWTATDPVTHRPKHYVFKTGEAVPRWEMAGRLMIPFHLLDTFHLAVIPVYHGVYYGESLTGITRPEYPAPELAGEGLFRHYGALDLKLEGPRLYRIFSVAGAPFKHVMETGASWRWAGDAGDYERVIKFGPEDVRVATNEGEIHITNRLIGKRGGSAWEWASLTIRQKYFADPEFGGALIPGRENQFNSFYEFSPFLVEYQPRYFSPLQLTARVNPAPAISLDFRYEYDTHYHKSRDFSAGGTLTREWLFVSAAYMRLQAYEQMHQTSNYLLTSTGFGYPRKGWSADVNTSINIRTSHLDDIYCRLNYFTDCLGFSLEYERFDVTGVRKDNQVRFAIFFKGLGEFGASRTQARRIY